MNNHEQFLNHMYQAVQDKFDLSDSDMDRLLHFLKKFDSPRKALQNALREGNNDAIRSIMLDLSRKESDKGSVFGPGHPKDSFVIPVDVPISQNMIINNNT